MKNFCIRNSGRGIVVLLSDLMDKTGYEAALRYLLSRDLDVYVIQILSAAEIDPDIKGDLRLIDCVLSGTFIMHSLFFSGGEKPCHRNYSRKRYEPRNLRVYDEVL